MDGRCRIFFFSVKIDSTVVRLIEKEGYLDFLSCSRHVQAPR